MSNGSPREFYRGGDEDTLDTFLKQNSNESDVRGKKKKKKFNVGYTVRINRIVKVFQKGSYLWSTELFITVEGP